MKRFSQIILIIMFLAVIFTIPVATKLEGYQEVSKFENRKLAEPPVLTRSSLLSGEYFSKWETYLSDHIYGRNNWIKSYTFLNMQVLRRDNINNIVLGADGFLLPFLAYDEKYHKTNSEENLSEMAEQLKELEQHVQKNGGSFCFVGVPSQASYHREKYPWYMQNSSKLMDETEKRMFASLDRLGVQYINMNEVFRKEPEVEFYYKTDHHYNFDGAYRTYYQIVRKLQLISSVLPSAPLEKEELDIITLPNPFGGSRNRQIYYMHPTEEHLQIAYPKNKIAYEKQLNGKPSEMLYYTKKNENEMLNYGVYMGGDWAETVIRTNNDKLPNLLLFGDSFTNAIEPLLYYHFNETRILDLRHYDKMTLFDYIDKYKPDAVVLVRDDLNYGNLEGNGSFKRKKQ